MIVRTNSDYLLLMTQPDHAALAGTIMAAWRADGLPTLVHRNEVLFATRHHDEGWRNVDTTPLVSQKGQILDFITAPSGVRQDVWPRAVERFSTRPYAAALIAQHALHIHDRSQSNPEWRGFLSRMQQLRNRLAAAATPSVTPDDLLRDYFFVRMGDTLSLTFCSGWCDPRREGAYEISFDLSRLVVKPDPFEGGEVRLVITARQLPRRLFGSREDAEATFATAPIATLTAVASGP